MRESSQERAPAGDEAEHGSSEVRDAEGPAIPWEVRETDRNRETASGQFTHLPGDLVWGEVLALHVPESPSVLTGLPVRSPKNVKSN